MAKHKNSHAVSVGLPAGRLENPAVKISETMIRFGNIYPGIYEYSNLELAHANAQKDKQFYKEVQMVNADPEPYLLEIQRLLETKTYRVSPYIKQVINDKGKERTLYKLPYFPDRIVQWAIVLKIELYLMQTFTDFTCASIKDRGIRRARDLSIKAVSGDREECRYCLKIDIRKFYPSINKDILKQMLRHKFKDPDLLWLLDLIIDSFPEPKGIPIGSYLSQYLANFYLSGFDHWLVEHEHPAKVVRFMDDVCIYGSSCKRLHEIMDDIKEYTEKNLDIHVKDNWQVFPVDVRGVDFVGYRFFPDYILLRKGTCHRFETLAKSVKAKQDKHLLINKKEFAGLNSYAGYLMNCDSYRLYEKYIEPVIPSMILYYRKVVMKGRPAKEVKKRTVNYLKHLRRKKGRRS